MKTGKSHARFASSRRGFALVLVLGFVVLLTVIVLAFFSNSIIQRRVADNSANQTKADLFAQGAMDDVIGDLKQEIVDGSTTGTYTAGTTTTLIYTPSTAATMIPYRAGSDPSWTNLIKRSSRGVAFYPTGSGYAQSGPSRAANVSTTQASLNGRYYNAARWNAALLLPPNSASDFTPNTTTAFTPPDWILVAQDGSNPTTWNANMKASPFTMTSVTGRYAYCVYNEGGLLDINVAGNLSSNSPTAANSQVPYKNAEAYADLTQLTDSSGNPYITQSQIDQIVNWRNAASLQQAGTGSLTPYDSYVMSNPTGFLKTANTALTSASPAGQSDRMFTSRQQLLDFFANNLGGGLALDNALQYLTTFSRDVSQPAFAPNPNRPLVLAASAGGNNGTGFDNLVNPSFLSKRVNASFTRNDGTTAIVGEPLVKKRFSLNRLAWLTYLGPSAKRTMTDADMVQLQTYGMTQAWLLQGTDQNIQNYFGLTWDSGNRRWNYSTHNSGGSGTGAIMKLGDIAALGSSARDPDFFELLKAAVNMGSLAKVSTDSTGGGNTAYSNQYYIDYDVDDAIIQMGVNIISQADVTNYPPRILFNDGSGGPSNCGAPAGATEFRGVKNLPYINRIRSSVLMVHEPTRTDGASPYTGVGSFGTNDSAAILDAGLGVYMKIPEIWNPHDYNISNLTQTMGVVGPTAFEIYAETSAAGDVSPNYPLPTSILAQTNQNHSWYYSNQATTGQSPGLYYTYFGINGEQRTMNHDNTYMRFSILQTVAGAQLFREPTILFQHHVPVASQLVATPLESPNSQPTGVGNIVNASAAASPPIFNSNLGFNCAKTSDDGTGMPTVGASYIGFYVAAVPLQWMVTPPNSPSPIRCPALTLPAPGYYVINYFLRYFDPVVKDYVAYDEKEGNFDSINGLMQNPEAGFIHPLNLFGHREELVDPRTDRFNLMTCHTGGGGYTRYYPPPFSAAIAGTGESGWLNMALGIVLSARNGTSYGTVASVPGYFASNVLGWYPGNWSQGDSPTGFRPGAYSQNNPDVTSADQNISDQTGGDNGYPNGADVAQYYADADGVVRRAMAGYSSVATHTAPTPSSTPPSTPLYGFPMATANTSGTTQTGQSGSRPVILNRPFRTVAELGYTFSGTPWKNIDFFTPESGDSALLDLFCIQDTDNSTALVAGKVDLNTRQVPVLQAIVAGAYQDEWTSTSGTTTIPGGISSLAQKIAQQLVTRTTDVTTKSGTTLVNGPLQNPSELVGKWVQQQNASGGGIDGSKSYSGFSGDLNSVLTNPSNAYNTERFREATMRALSASGQTRVWNLMIDLVAQVGRYPHNASGPQDFNVEGEQRYWVHIAIDRLTGQVLDKQVEIVRQ